MNAGHSLVVYHEVQAGTVFKILIRTVYLVRSSPRITPYPTLDRVLDGTAVGVV
jgi:hypothetical protein